MPLALLLAQRLAATGEMAASRYPDYALRDIASQPQTQLCFRRILCIQMLQDMMDLSK